MRPTDENQPTFMRPNLMSPRRVSTSGEDSILALLEREPARKRGSNASAARRAWYGVGAGLAVALTGTLVWLAAGNDGVRRHPPDVVLAEAASAERVPTAAPGAGAALRQVAMAPAAPDARPGSAALIVDGAPAEAVPALRLLKPAPGKATEKLVAAARVPVPVPAPAPAATAPARPLAKATPAPRQAPAAQAEAKPAARPAATPARPRSALVAQNAARPAPPKNARGAGPARNADGPVDADVALISAVIVHANGHAPEGSQMTELLCPNDSCKAKPARQ